MSRVQHERNAMIWLLCNGTDLPSHQIGALFGISENRVRELVGRLERRIARIHNLAASEYNTEPMMVRLRKAGALRGQPPKTSTQRRRMIRPE